MAAGDATLHSLIRAIAANDTTTVSSILSASPDLAGAKVERGATRQASTDNYLVAIGHYMYGGDTALHIAAAAYRHEIVRSLVDLGADVSARNRRGAQPLHYAADGIPGSNDWNPRAQGDTVTVLIQAGADPNATDKSGVTPLLRAVRTRCSAAVRSLLEGGADVNRANKSGSTPLQLAKWTTGRGGSGTPEAKAQQEEIVYLLHEYGAALHG